MNYMTVYKLSFEDLGDKVMLCPSIPKHPAKGEDTTTPRICCAPTIMGCINGLEVVAAQNVRLNKKDGDTIKLYLYVTVVDIDFLYQPTIDEVPDQWLTGEMWIRGNQMFYKVLEYNLRKHMDIPNSAYSRYSMTSINEEEVLDIHCASVVYGDIKSFSFIEHNPLRDDLALKYAEENPYQY